MEMEKESKERISLFKKIMDDLTDEEIKEVAKIASIWMKAINTKNSLKSHTIKWDLKEFKKSILGGK